MSVKQNYGKIRPRRAAVVYLPMSNLFSISKILSTTIYPCKQEKGRVSQNLSRSFDMSFQGWMNGNTCICVLEHVWTCHVWAGFKHPRRMVGGDDKSKNLWGWPGGPPRWSCPQSMGEILKSLDWFRAKIYNSGEPPNLNACDRTGSACFLCTDLLRGPVLQSKRGEVSWLYVKRLDPDWTIWEGRYQILSLQRGMAESPPQEGYVRDRPQLVWSTINE